MGNSPTSRSSLDVGAVVSGTYRVEAVIGRGGMGTVYVASHARLPGKAVAIKVLRSEVAGEDAIARFRREAEIASRLGHPNIVEVHDFNELPDGTPYLVLEYLQGESLDHRLERGPLSLEETFTLVRQIGSALAAAHREGIIHRDLKPQNVFLVPADGDDPTALRAKVLDFGISKIRGSQTVQTQDSAILGTPQYMAPEQATGQHASVDARTDVFALGAMVYEMLCGQPAFPGATIPEVVFKVVYQDPLPLGSQAPGVPDHVAAAVARAMAKKPADRWNGVAEFIEALTGSPLVTMRSRATSAPRSTVPGGPASALVPGTPTVPERGKVKTGEALAQTVSSGDYADVVVATAETVASGERRPVLAGARNNGIITDAPTEGDRPRRARSSKRWIAAGAALAVAAIAIPIVVLSGSDEAPAPRVASPRPAAPPRSVPAPVPPRAPVPDPPSSVPVPVPPSSAPVPDSPSPGPVPPSPVPDSPSSAPAPPSPSPSLPSPRVAHSDTDAENQTPDDPLLTQAESALADDPDSALRMAKRILNRAPGNPHAWALRARAHCALGDREGALTALRKLDGNPRIRRRAVKACKAAGMEL